MRFISNIDWSEQFEKMSLVDQQLRASTHFAEMDFPTRNLYRRAIELLARSSPHDELDVTARVLSATRQDVDTLPDDMKLRVQDPGYHLMAEGRLALETDLGFRPPYAFDFTGFIPDSGSAAMSASSPC